MVNSGYWRPVASLSLVMACRMLGLFMLMPVFAVVAPSLSGSTPFLVGAVLAAYGLTQAIFQIPFGFLSDRWGRRPVIALGLFLFALGSVIAAMSHSIQWVLIGRAVQGAGAVGSTILASVADFTPNEHRARAMAVLGLGIGVSFGLAMVLGPVLVHAYGLSGLFWFMLFLSVLASGLLWGLVPKPPRMVLDSVVAPVSGWAKALRTPQLLKLDFSIFTQHAILTALFLALPLLLTDHFGLTPSDQSLFYLIVFALAFVLMVPGVLVAEKYRRMRTVFIVSVAIMACCLLALSGWESSFIGVSVLLLLFFTAFTLMESILPSCVSKVAPLASRGTAMGVYSTSQFLGIFAGGLLGGWVFSRWHVPGVFLFTSLLAFAWLLVALRLKAFPYLSTVIFSLNRQADLNQESMSSRLLSVPGVAEVAWQTACGRLYLKIDRKITGEDALRKLIGEGNLRQNSATSRQ